MKKLIIIHNIGLCEHKTFFGMQNGHCIKCGKAFKNCDVCFPNTKLVNKITFTKGCPWCLQQISENEFNEHPKNCVYYQEYLRQIV